jgi:phosphoribosyl-AMP cyclohydrolase
MEPRFDKLNGLLPAVIQDAETGEVLMVAFMNEEAYRRTLETGRMHYYSRSRGALWMKGETSGHVQEVKEVLIDCDEDTALFKIRQVGGAACHTGFNSCFFRRVETDGSLTQIKAERVFDPAKVYGT